jgi:Tol biopolymer transport system component
MLRVAASSRQPAWAPDGTQLAFTAPGEHPGQGRSLGILDARTGQVRTVPTGLRGVRFPEWSPDGRELAAESTDGAGKSGIFRIAAGSGEVVPVVVESDARPGFRRRPTWSPDGRRLYYAYTPANGDSVVLEHDLGAGTEREVQGSRRLLDASISPDGRYLLGFTRNRDAGTSELRLVDVASGDVRVVYSVKLPEVLTWVRWTPDGRHALLKHVADSASRPLNAALLVPIDGGAPTRLDLPGVTFGYMSLNPDGSRIAYQAGKEEREVWVLENFLPPVSKAARK